MSMKFYRKMFLTLKRYARFFQHNSQCLLVYLFMEPTPKFIMNTYASSYNFTC